MIRFFLTGLLSNQLIGIIEYVVYYFCISLAILLCWWLIYKRLIVYYDKRRIRKFILICVVLVTSAGVVGSLSANMFYYPIRYWSLNFFFNQIIEADHHTFHGGLILSTILFFILTLIFRLDFLKVSDTYFLYLPIGHSIGRTACLLIGCCWGKVCQITIFNKSFIINNPTPIYSIIFLLSLFILSRTLYTSIYINQKHPKHQGLITSIYLMFYGIFRFIVEFYRSEPVVELGFTQAQIVMIFLFLIGFGIFSATIIKAHGQKH